MPPRGCLIGAQLVGPNASELIGELSMAVECALRLDDLVGTIHAHPTLGEAIVAAGRAAQRRLDSRVPIDRQTLVR